MSTPKKTSSSGKKPLPGWLRLVLVLTPICVCLPLTGTAIFVAVRQIDVQSANSTIVALETVAAAETAGSRERQQATSQAATEGVGAAGTLQAAVQATATALAASGATATQEATPTTAAGTATPAGLVTLTLIECRGFDGLVFLDGSAGSEFLAFTTISFKLSRGAHHLEIIWTDNPDSNIETQLDLQKDTTMVFGDPCT
jgi:hypothetical protein